MGAFLFSRGRFAGLSPIRCPSLYIHTSGADRLVFVDSHVYFMPQILHGVFASAPTSGMDFFSQEREKTIKKLGSVDDDGAVSFAPGKQQEAEKAIAELLAMEVSPDAVVIRIPLSSNVRLTAGDIEALTPFVEFADSEQEELIWKYRERLFLHPLGA